MNALRKLTSRFGKRIMGRLQSQIGTDLNMPTSGTALSDFCQMLGSRSSLTGLSSYPHGHSMAMLHLGHLGGLLANWAKELRKEQ